MKPRPKITARSTSLAHAFVHAIIPRRVNAEEQRSLYDKVDLKLEECAYCGSRATDSDHFRALVKAGRPSGHFHTADNIVPSCGPCNQSKGGQYWKKWILGGAKGSPTKRGVPDVANRVERLSCFEALSGKENDTDFNLRDAAGSKIWDDYWSRLDRIKLDLEAAEKAAAVIRDRLEAAFRAREISN